jgi:hypothetical protein
MGLRCSLLGHDYGEPFVERGREERGNEVVVTERELQECSRCGAENVTTENTEVRSIQPTSESTSTASAGAGTSADAAGGSSTASGTSAESSSGDATTASSDSSGGAFTSASDAIERAEAGMQADDAQSTAGSATAGSDSTSASDDGDDDAVIIDDSADDTAGSEQWDEQETVDPDTETTPAPEPDGEDVEFVDSGPTGDVNSPPGGDTESAGAPTSAGSDSPERESADAKRSQSGGAQSSSAQAVAGRPSDRTRGEWPEPEGEDVGVDATDDSGSFQFGDDSEQFVEADTGFTSAGPLEQSGGENELDYALYCPECGFERHAAGSSLRAGDICPDCRKGYIAEGK